MKIECQEPVRRETTEGSSIEFIGYLKPQHEQNDSQGISKQRCVRLFRYSDWLSRYRRIKLEWLKICEACCVNGRHGTNISNIEISRHPFVCH